jgi:hypothetical protein
MKKTLFFSFMVLFAVSAKAQLVDVRHEFMMAKLEKAASQTPAVKIEKLEVKPEYGPQPEGKFSQVSVIFSYVNDQLTKVESSCPDNSVVCGDPEKTMYNYYSVKWCYRADYNILWGCSEGTEYTFFAQAPKF